MTIILTLTQRLFNRCVLTRSLLSTYIEDNYLTAMLMAYINDGSYDNLHFLPSLHLQIQ